MKMTSKLLRHCAVLPILVAACVLGEQSAQAQQRRIPIPAEARERGRQSYLLSLAAAADLHAGHYALAETEVRKALSVESFNGVGQEVLAAALDAQGKDREALQAYQTVIEHVDGHARSLMPYALLLLKSGQWARAVTAYNQAAIPYIGQGELEVASSYFSADVREPTALAVAIHIERGQLYSEGCGWVKAPQNSEAVAEYAKALQLAPNSALTNYYYGSAWQKLSPTEQAKSGSATQARTALEKAVKLGKGRLKRAAQEALLTAKAEQMSRASTLVPLSSPTTAMF